MTGEGRWVGRSTREQVWGVSRVGGEAGDHRAGVGVNPGPGSWLLEWRERLGGKDLPVGTPLGDRRPTTLRGCELRTCREDRNPSG